MTTREKRNAASRAYYARHTEKQRAYRKAYYKKNKTRLREYQAEYYRQHRPIRMGICPICTKYTRLVFDHDHVTGQHRGYPCVRCNSNIEWFMEHKGRMEEYLITAYGSDYNERCKWVTS